MSVVILLRPVGDAPQLSQNRYKISANERFAKIVQTLQTKAKLEQPFVYLKESFSPSLDEKISTLFQNHMSRRSPSPDGVGDLLKHDSFANFDDDETMEPDTAMTGVAEQDDDDFDVKLDEQGDGIMKEADPNGVESKQRVGRQPIPHFPATSFTKAPEGNARYFIIKCNNHSNIDQSLKYGIWATQKHNEDKLVEAFKTGPVYLIFSVNMSGHFQGYAKMHSLPFKHKQGLWGGGAAVSNSFDIEWVRRHDLAFRDLEHIRNPLNEDKPIKISRDGQELPPNLGHQVLQLFDQGAAMKGTADPPKADRNHDFNVGPAVGGYAFFRGGGQGRGGPKGPQPPRGPPPSGQFSDKQGPMGMIMTPMGPMPAQMAMQMGMMGMDFNPAMMGMPNPMMGMGMNGMDQMAAMQAMMGGRAPGMMGGMPPGPRGPVPPPKPPPPKSPPRETDYMKQMMETAFRNMRGGERDRDRDRDRGRNREDDFFLRAMEGMSRRGGSPSRDRYRYRSRSRSPSPRRHRSHRRSRSRSRSRSGGRHRDKVADMSYEDYLEAYNALKRVRKEKDGGLDFAGGMSGGMNPMMAQMASMMGASKPQRPANASLGAPQMSNMANRQPANASGGVGNMSEDEYVRVWETYSKSMGTAFDPAVVRGWYRQHKQMKK